MPPSPASLRCSPGRELHHRRGHSIEYGTLFREKDDNLALFSEMQNKERESFLLQSNDDFEDAFSSKLKHFSQVTIPVQGESSRLLNADGDKNDYDWLLTPPETPLFPSLDDEPPKASTGSRGRPREPISLSRSSTMEKSHRSSRGSPSPNRLSMHQMRGKASTARQASPTPTIQSITPIRSTSPSPSKPSKPTSRSSTPTSRRMSTGSNATSSPANFRGASPSKTTRGNSTSPTTKAWQSNIPGFSLDAPPNLRTSLTDRSASYTRGSSPASRSGRDSVSTRHSRQSISPTASRSVSSCHSHSKGSVASSGDDDLDSIQSILIGGSDRPASKRGSLSPNRRAPRSSKLLSPSSAPKRPFESALRQMDHYKSHRNMFRPLVSSVPSSGLYAGKDSSTYHHIILRHSSASVGSNGSSGQVVGFSPESKPLDDFHIESGTIQYPNKHEEISALRVEDFLNEETIRENHQSNDAAAAADDDDDDNDYDDEISSVVGNCLVGNALGAKEELNDNIVDDEISSMTDSLPVAGNCFGGNALETIEICSRCGCKYGVSINIESEINICSDCRERNDLVAENSAKESLETREEMKSLVEINSAMNVEQDLDNLRESNATVIEVRDEIQQPCDFDSSKNNENDSETLLSDENRDLKVEFDNLLIKRSSSMKLPASKATSCSDINKRSNSLRSSAEHAAAAASVSSSSSDYDLSMKSERKNGNKSELSHGYDDMNSKSIMTSTMSSSSERAPSVMVGNGSEVFDAEVTCNVNETSQEPLSEIRDSGSKGADSMSSDRGECSGLISNCTQDLLTESNSVNEDNGEALCENGDEEDSGEHHSLLMDDQEEEKLEIPEVESSTIAMEIELERCDHEFPESIGNENCSDPSCSSEKDAEISAKKHVSSVRTNGISDESTVLVDCNGGEQKSLTLEEATDTILLCSSIVHDLAYNAAALAIEKADEEEEEPMENPRPAVTILGKSNGEMGYGRGGTKAKRRSRSGKNRQKEKERDAKASKTMENDENEGEAESIGNGGDVNKGDSLKPLPPKLESKCNCSIM